MKTLVFQECKIKLRDIGKILPKVQVSNDYGLDLGSEWIYEPVTTFPHNYVFTNAECDR